MVTATGRLYRLSTSPEPFSDRSEAGRLLAEQLQRLMISNEVVLGIPRGGMVVAREVARILAADLDIVLARKIGAPGNPEFAIAAVSETGNLVINEQAASWVDADEDYLTSEKQRQVVEIERRVRGYRGVRPKVSLAGKRVTVVDDGIATGTTMRAALWAVRQEGASHLTAAVPVGPDEVLRELVQDADEVVCLRAPAGFAAVGQFYLQFDQTEDDDVVAILRDENARAVRQHSQ